MALQTDFTKATGESDMAFKRVGNTVVESCENVLGKIYTFFTCSVTFKYKRAYTF